MGKIYVSCKYGDNTKKLKFIVTGHSTSTHTQQVSNTKYLYIIQNYLKA